MLQYKVEYWVYIYLFFIEKYVSVIMSVETWSDGRICKRG